MMGMFNGSSEVAEKKKFEFRGGWGKCGIRTKFS